MKLKTNLNFFRTLYFYFALSSMLINTASPVLAYVSLGEFKRVYASDEIQIDESQNESQKEEYENSDTGSGDNNTDIGNDKENDKEKEETKTNSSQDETNEISQITNESESEINDENQKDDSTKNSNDPQEFKLIDLEQDNQNHTFSDLVNDAQTQTQNSTQQNLVPIKINLCHATNSNANPYNLIEVNINSVSDCQNVSGHGDHEDDIIPPFTYGVCEYPGKNWDEVGQAIHKNGCSIELGSVTIRKVVEPQDNSEWDFTLRKKRNLLLEYTIDDLSHNESQTINVRPGRYIVEEQTSNEYDTFVSCNNSNPAQQSSYEILVLPGQSVECIFTNQKIYVPVCGNNIVDEREDCDYGPLNGQYTCSTSCKWVSECSSQLIVNESFEYPALSSSGSWDIFDNTTFVGWQANWYGGSSSFGSHTRPGPKIEVHRGVNGWVSAHGSQHVELDSDWTGPVGNFGPEPASISLTQKVPTIVGYTYTLSWKYSPRPNYDKNHLQVSVNGNEVFNSGVLVGGSNVNWQSASYTFVADSNLATITFTELGEADSYGMFLDDISLSCTPSRDVTVCKAQKPIKGVHGWLNLPGWRLYLLGEHVDTFDVPSNGSVVSKSYPAGNYVLLASGTYNYGDERMNADAANSFRYVGLPCAGSSDGWVNGDASSCMNHYLSLNSSASGGPTYAGWGEYFNPAHIYAKAYFGGPLNFKIWDSCSTTGEGCYGDNEGSLTVNVYRGFVGDTGEDGCVTFENVSYGTYKFGEIMQDGYEYDSGAEQVEINEKLEMPLTIFNRKITGNTPVSSIEVEKMATNFTLHGKEVTYTYIVKNTGETPLSNIQLSDDNCSNINFVSGGLNPNGTLEINGEWIYQCKFDTSNTDLNQITNTAKVTGTYNGVTVSDEDTTTIYKTKVNKIIYKNNSFEELPNDETYFDIRVYIYGTTKSIGKFSVSQKDPKEIWLSDKEFNICETVPNGYTNAQNKCVYFGKDSRITDITFYNYKLPTKLVATKIVCENEADLPNWGSGGPDITANTATDWVAKHQSCRFEKDWEFEYGPLNSGNPGDTYVGPAGGSYNKFNPTDSNGTTSVDIYDLSLYNGRIEVREVLKPNYLNFSYGPSGGTNSNNVSAEIYCGSDVLNYDNWEWINNPQYGQTYYCVAWNVKLGGIKGFKWADSKDVNGQYDKDEARLPGWTIYIDLNDNGQMDEDEPSTLTSADKNLETYGWYEFSNLLPGTYKVCEAQQEGWAQTYPGDNECHNVVVTGEDGNATYNFGNTNTASVILYKYLDANSNGEFDEGEEYLQDWDFGLNPVVRDDDDGPFVAVGDTIVSSTNAEGYAQFNVESGFYSISELEFTDEGGPRWELTSIECSDEIYGDNVIYATPNEEIVCVIGNYYHKPSLSISKSNNAVGNKVAGDQVLFTIKVKAEKGPIYNVEVKDLFSEGFSYVSGSWTAISNIRGDLKALAITPEPLYSSPGIWLLGDMYEGEEVTLTYKASVGEEIDSGVYKDLAWVVGKNLFDEDVIGQAESLGYISENFVGTQVSVFRNQPAETAKAKVKVKEQKEEVLGAATTRLPATGLDTLALLAIILVTLSGAYISIRNYVLIKKNGTNNKNLMALLLIAISLGITTGINKTYATSYLSVRMEKPQSPVGGPFKITFVAMDIKNRALSAECYTDSSSTPYQTMELVDGGNTQTCAVNPSDIGGSGNYNFWVKVYVKDNPSEHALSNMESVVINTNIPGRPKYIEKEKKGDCKYEVTFKTASDGGTTSYVEIYRGDDKEFTISESNKVATFTIGSDQKKSFNDELYGTECAKKPYYAVRAFNTAGVPSSVRSEEIEKTVKVEIENKKEKETPAQAVEGVTVGIPQQNQEETPQVVMEKPQEKSAEEEVLGEQDKQQKEAQNEAEEVKDELMDKKSEQPLTQRRGILIIPAIILGLTLYLLYAKNRKKL